MVPIIICGHGNLAEGMLAASEMVFGGMDQITAVKFLPEEGVLDLIKKYEAAAAGFDDKEEILILVDIFGGSPYNAAARYAVTHPGTEVVTGVNLPMLIEVLSLRNSGTVQDVVDSIRESYSDYYHTYSEMIAHRADEEEL